MQQTIPPAPPGVSEKLWRYAFESQRADEARRKWCAENGIFVLASYEHTVGDDSCMGCPDHPRRCQCGGLVHEEYTTKLWRAAGGELRERRVLISRCDQCGDQAVGRGPIV